MRTWILVANRSGATLFERASRADMPVVLKMYPHEEGRLKDSAIDTDRRGRVFDRHGEGGHATSSEVLPTEHLAETYAKALAVELNQGMHENAFDDLVLIAEPRFLGRIRDNLHADTIARVRASFSKDLPAPDVAAVVRYLDQMDD